MDWACSVAEAALLEEAPRLRGAGMEMEAMVSYFSFQLGAPPPSVRATKESWGYRSATPGTDQCN